MQADFQVRLEQPVKVVKSHPIHHHRDEQNPTLVVFFLNIIFVVIKPDLISVVTVGDHQMAIHTRFLKD
ncbi:hypothetical protein Syn6312_3612 [Synechococcus sp. PCC 6312]|nr:hypothetical protein Syn6312_3612 [Synechococcus sp. PCC 6312]